MWWKAKVLEMRNREQPRPFLGGRQLPTATLERLEQYTGYTWNGEHDSIQEPGAKLDAKTSKRQGKEEGRLYNSDKRKAGSSAEVRGSRRNRRQTDQGIIA